MFWKKKNEDNSAQYSVVEYHEPKVASNSYASSVAPKNIAFPGQEFLTYEKANEYVKMAQLNLIENGYEIPGGANGTYGIATVKAVSRFYLEQGLGSNTGNHIGPKAWNKLFGNE